MTDQSSCVPSREFRDLKIGTNKKDDIYLFIFKEFQYSHCDVEPSKDMSGFTLVGRSQYLEDSGNRDLKFRFKVETICEFSYQHFGFSIIHMDLSLTGARCYRFGNVGRRAALSIRLGWL
jgi:hypothetical protein